MKFIEIIKNVYNHFFSKKDVSDEQIEIDLSKQSTTYPPAHTTLVTSSTITNNSGSSFHKGTLNNLVSVHNLVSVSSSPSFFNGTPWVASTPSINFTNSPPSHGIIMQPTVSGLPIVTSRDFFTDKSKYVALDNIKNRSLFYDRTIVPITSKFLNSEKTFISKMKLMYCNSLNLPLNQDNGTIPNVFTLGTYNWSSLSNLVFLWWEYKFIDSVDDYGVSIGDDNDNIYLAFVSEKSRDDFNDWLDQYIKRFFPVSNGLSDKTYSIVNSYPELESGELHSFAVPIGELYYDPDELKKEWAWIIDNCVGKVSVLHTMLFFDNLTDATLYRLSFK